MAAKKAKSARTNAKNKKNKNTLGSFSETAQQSDSPARITNIEQAAKPSTPNPEAEEPVERPKALPRPNKRKRGPDTQSDASEKVLEWQEDQNGNVVEEPRTPRKRLRSLAPPPSIDKATHPPCDEREPDDIDHLRPPTHKELRALLRELEHFPNERIEMKLELEQTRKAITVAQTIYQTTEADLTEIQWTRYIVEEDLLRRQKREPTLVDGTEKLGKGSLQASTWKEWVKANSVSHRPEDMGWGYWKRRGEAEKEEEQTA